MEISSEAGWFADPLGRHAHRWWSGTYWTEHVADSGHVGIDPLDSPATAAATAGAPPPPPGPPVAAPTQPTAGASSPGRQPLLVGAAIAGVVALVIGGIVLFTGDSAGDGDSAAAPVADPISGATAASWCIFVEEADALGEMSLDLDPSQLEGEIAVAESIVQRLRSQAPEEIRGPANKLADANESLFNAIKAADYDMFNADFSFANDATLEADLEAALEALDAYSERECGRPFDAASDDFDDSDDLDLGDGTIRDQLATELESMGFTGSESSCLADAFDLSDPVMQDGGIDAVLDGANEQCNISPDRIEELRQVVLGGG